MIKTQLKIVHQAMHQSKFGEAQNATTDSLLTFLSVAGIQSNSWFQDPSWH